MSLAIVARRAHWLYGNELFVLVERKDQFFFLEELSKLLLQTSFGNKRNIGIRCAGRVLWTLTRPQGNFLEI